MLGYIPNKDVVKIEKLIGKFFGNGLTMNPDERTVYTLEYDNKNFWKFTPFVVRIADGEVLANLKAYFLDVHNINFSLSLSLTFEKTAGCLGEFIEVKHKLRFTGARGSIDTTVDKYIELIENASAKIVDPKIVKLIDKEYGTKFIEKINKDRVFEKINKIITKNIKD